MVLARMGLFYGWILPFLHPFKVHLFLLFSGTEQVLNIEGDEAACLVNAGF